MVTLKWELMTDADFKTGFLGHAGHNFHRAKIPGGWLVREDGFREHSLAFVPDPQHKWI